MTDLEQREAARQFYYTWKNRGDEKSDTQTFWLNLLKDVLQMENAESRIEFEKRVIVDGKTKFIDAFIPESHVLIEQKTINKSLSEKIRQSGGEELTPYQQAKRYSDNLPYDEKPRWIVLSNFEEIHIYDMNEKEPEKNFINVNIKDIQSQYTRLKFLIKEEKKIASKEIEISVKAGDIVGLIYDALLEQYADKTNPDSLKSLNQLCVRLVFCFYAEDSGLFGNPLMFHDYMSQFDERGFRTALIDLFKVLDTKIEDRDPYLDDELAKFPYVNGGLFKDENIEIPRFNEKIINLILKNGCEFDWSEISPTIFGAVFESTLNPETRRSGGMHYTSIENIHKVIDPLFLDDLKAELEDIKKISVIKTKKDKLHKYQDKLASLTFLDPACGSGNFLTETYTSLRKLENEAIRMLIDLKNGETTGQIMFGFDNFTPIKMSIGQFYGIEINDFAVTVAKTALWIAEHQMMKETENIVLMHLDFLPLKTNATIIEGNALQLDWNKVIRRNELSYIIGNPPFVGQSNRTKEQSEDMSNIFGKGSIITKQDYVLCWYEKALQYINTEGSPIDVAFVSTNSICQGEAVPTFWKHMVDNGVEILFAYTTFIWGSEATQKAHVHCVIVGFSNHKTNHIKRIFTESGAKETSHINCYLLDAPDIWLENRTNKAMSNLPKMTTGSPPTDDGGLLLTVEEKDELISKYPILTKYIKPFIGAREFLHDKMGQFSRYCLWFKGGNPSDYNKIKEITERLERVRNLRLSSKADRIQKMADYPYLFCQDRQPDNTYLVIPRHSSEKRRYIPIGFISPDIIAGDACTIVPNMNIYQFGIINSNVHNAWTRVVCGRLKSDFRYSPATYNNFPWCNPTPEQKAKIEETAQGILDARALYPDSSLADLYDELTMPPELRKAHQRNDAAVMKAYGFDIKNTTEESCVAKLMKMYKELSENEKKK